MTTIYAPRAITPTLRDEVLSAGECFYCCVSRPSCVDHVIPFSQGGSDDQHNLVAACSVCNIEKSDMTPEQWRAWREDRGWCWPPRSHVSPDGARVLADLYPLLDLFVSPTELLRWVENGDAFPDAYWDKFWRGATAAELVPLIVPAVMAGAS